MTSPLHHQESRSLSRRLVVATSLLFTGGVSIGWLHYLHKSMAPVRHMPGSNAWWQHGVVAVVAIAIAGVASIGCNRRLVGPRLLLAPLSRSAAERISLLSRQVLQRPGGFGRALAAAPLLLLVGYAFLRAGYQVTSGLDPNNTVNAWGGPTYLGAMACHYLDLFVGTAAAVWLLDRLLPRTASRPALTDSADGSASSMVHGSAG